ncbi:hypothetical protein [Xanthomarina sp. GH4-25]|uniref:hypothetical protein n=1 Tax=Xanthomarina sp. GH4-25 TaxID=3349335 RepID=UPI000D68395C|nr:hypothetical protein DI383_10995 [Flavobacteriaceae bacterium LYZ1037]
MTVSKKLFGALLLTCFLGLSQMTSAQTADSNTDKKTVEKTKVQEQSQVQAESEVKEEKAELKAREEHAVETKAVKEEEMESDKE